MTQDEIIELARDTANHGTHSSGEVIYTFYSEQLLAFAELVAEKEREACAKLFELTDLGGLKSDVWLQNYTATMLDGYAKAIRARGQA